MEVSRIIWDIGTAYDLFISLYVLHNPTEFGVRSTWASGMRQRLPANERVSLEEIISKRIFSLPLQWLSKMSEPKDSETAIQTLRKMPAIKRAFVLGDVHPDLGNIYKDVIENGRFSQEQLETYKAVYREIYYKELTDSKAAEKLSLWVDAQEYSERYLSALQAYYEVFFAEEERRILSALQDGLAWAQEKATKLNFSDLMFELSQGIRYEENAFQGTDEIVLAPSFWASPIIFYSIWQRTVIAFGARPKNASLVPGEIVPDSLVTALAALSDPTRLKILRYLAAESLTPTQLATRLRLRTPTVAHHLKSLRVAGLVVVLPDIARRETYYQTRIEGLQDICTLLKDFVLDQNGD
jgi:DNA-binding transcriptional ArsR family regulator